MKIDGYDAISRAEAAVHVAKIVAIIDEVGYAVPAGSFRRGKAMLEDLDFVVIPTVSPEEFWIYLREKFGPPVRGGGILGNPNSKLPKQVHSQGKYKLEGNLAVDIFLSPPGCLQAYLLFRTGSARFNVRQRSVAKRMGLSLSRYGLRNAKTNELVGEQTERGIFETLKMKWLEPRDRE